MTVKDILLKFDVEGNPLDLLDYAAQYRSCDDEEKNSIAYLSEVMASELTEDYTSSDDVFKGAFYFGPHRVSQNKEGEIIEYPDRKHITMEMVSYWERRIEDARNCILKARYSGLVWDFKSYVTREKCDVEVARTYIESLICIIDNDLSHVMCAVKYAERAIKLSKQVGMQDLLPKAKLALHNLISRHEKYDAIGIWGAAYTISTECPGSYTREEQESLVADLETRFTQIKRMSASVSERKDDPWLLMDLADILASYYKKHSPKKMSKLFEEVEESFDAVSANIAKLQLVGCYNQLHELLIKYGLKDRASQLSVKIAKCGNGIQNEMVEFEQQASVPKEDMDSFVNSIWGSGNIETSFLRFTYSFVPKRDREKESLQKAVKQAPFIYMIPQSIFDEKGYVKTVVGNIENDLEGNLVVHISTSMQYYTIFLNIVIEEGRRRGIFTAENILSFMTLSPFVKSDRIPIVAKGVEAYFDKDYLVSIHLLIPQIEEIVRNIVEINNITIIKSNKQGTGFRLRLLDEMLRDNAVIKLLTVDMANYLRILLTDSRGWNLRNDVCHGSVSVDIFNKMTADRIIHALLCLGVFRIQSNKLKYLRHL